jgi:small subunit ribosomal protein S3
VGQKVNPVSFRLGVNHSWKSRWFVERKKYSELLFSDLKIRDFIISRFGAVLVSDVIIERLAQKICVTVCSSRPGLIIGKKGSLMESFKADLDKLTNSDTVFNIVEISKPDLDVNSVAYGIAKQLEKRISFKRAMKRATQSAMSAGAKGIKIICSGRLGGAEIARSEKFSAGSVPLQKIRADVNYACATAYTAYGTIGIKVWIYLGDISCYDPNAYDRRLSS